MARLRLGQLFTLGAQPRMRNAIRAMHELLVVDPATQQLTLIDTDSYQNTFSEVTGCTPGWSRRDDFESRFFQRGVGRLVSRICLCKQKAAARRNSELGIANVLETSGF